MNDAQNAAIFALKRTRSGAIILEFQPWQLVSLPTASLRSLVRLVRIVMVSISGSVTTVAGRFTHALIVGSLGLGLGLGLSIAVQPKRVTAFPEVVVAYETVAPKPELIQLKTDRESRLPIKIGVEPPIFANKKSATWIQDTRPLAVGGVTTIYYPSSDKLAELTIGDQVRVLANNQGWYNFHVVEVRHIDRSQFGQITNLERESLVIYSRLPNPSSLLVLIAR